MKKQDEITKVRDAMMLAADDVEKEGQWDFMKESVPSCGTPGCALGWIGARLGISAGRGVYEVAKALGMGEYKFYCAMNAILTPMCGTGIPAASPEHVAAALRQFAQEWKP